MRSLQLRLHRLWDRKDDSALISWSSTCRQDLEWWIVPDPLELGLSLDQVNPNLDFWSDASDVGWGAHMLDVTASSLCSPEEVELSINARELLVVERGFVHFSHLVTSSTVAIFSDNSTAIAYLRKQGGTRSPILNSITQRILRWAETVDLVLALQFIHSKNNVLADSLSRPNQIRGSEWALKWEGFLELSKRWPVTIDLFAASLNHRCSLHDTAGSVEALIIFWGSHDSRCSILASETVVSGPYGSGGRLSDSSSSVAGSSQAASLSLSSSRDPQAVTSCLETIKRFAKSKGFSSWVATQIGFARRSSSRAVYQAKWLVYRRWCRIENHSISCPTLPKIADFLLWLRTSKIYQYSRSWDTGPCCHQFLDLNSRIFHLLLFFMIYYDCLKWRLLFDPFNLLGI